MVLDAALTGTSIGPTCRTWRSEAAADDQKEAEERAAKWEAEQKKIAERTQKEEEAARAAAQAETDRIKAEYEANQKRRAV